MEETENLTPVMSLEVPSETIQWLWQSDPDPWKEKDSALWKWTPYSHDLSECIEKASSLNNANIDIGNYEIDLKKMLQINKRERNRVRRIKREVIKNLQSRFLIELPKPSIIEKEQKTINNAFGNVQHFLNYIMKRTPQAYKLFQQLKGLSLSAHESDFKDIIQEVIDSVQKGAEMREKIIKTRSNSPKSFILEAKQIVDEILSESRDLMGFLKFMLKIYTMETFICYWLNELLRSENWEEINVLTPYLVCLTYTFQLQDYVIKHEKPKGFRKTLKTIITRRQKLVLYRGTALPKELLTYYNPMKNKHFSWNGVTSTSRSKEQAIIFISHSLSANANKQAKIGVLFVIETDFYSPQDCEGMIDVSEYSKFPHEQEVILSPGTVFKLISTQLNPENDIYEVRLELRKKFEDNQKDIALLGTLYNKVIFDDKAILDSLSRDETVQILQLLEGNQLIKKLEIRNSLIDSHIMEILTSTRKSTNIRKEDIQLINNQVIADSIDSLLVHYAPENFTSMYTYNDVKFKYDIDDAKWAKPHLKLYIKGEMLEVFHQISRLPRLWNRLVLQKNIEYIYVETSGWEISTFELKDLKNVLKRLLYLHPPVLEFIVSEINEEDIYDLKNALESNSDLQRLDLSFKNCLEISDETIILLSDALTCPASLNHMSLGFIKCSTSSETVLSTLIQNFGSFTSLQHLALGFGGSFWISDLELNKLKNIFQSLIELKHLSLNFSYISEISDQTIENINSAIVPLKCLQHLFICLDWRVNENSKSLDNKEKHLDPLINSLRDFYIRPVNQQTWNFSSLSRSLSALKYLFLNFDGCNSSHYVLSHFRDITSSLSSLKHLCIDLENCYNVSTEGIIGLINTIKSLTSLQHVSFHSRWCLKASEKKLEINKILYPSSTDMRLTQEYNSSIDQPKPDRLLDDIIESLLLLQNTPYAYDNISTNDYRWKYKNLLTKKLDVFGSKTALGKKSSKWSSNSYDSD